MKPLSPVFHSETGFINIDHVRIYQLLFDCLIGGFYVFYKDFTCLKNGSFRWSMTKEVLKTLTGTLQWDELVVVQVRHYCFDSVTILHWRCRTWWKRSDITRVAMRTPLDLCLMFGHFQFYWRNVNNLTRLIAIDFNIFKWGTAMCATTHFVYFNVIGIFHWFQGVTFMPFLSPVLPATFLPQTFSTWLLEPIARRWLAAVFAVFV